MPVGYQRKPNRKSNQNFKTRSTCRSKYRKQKDPRSESLATRARFILPRCCARAGLSYPNVTAEGTWCALLRHTERRPS